MFGEGYSEIVLIVADVRAAAAFYREVVGLTPETEPDARVDAGHLLLLL